MKKLLFIVPYLFISLSLSAAGSEPFISFKPLHNSFPIVGNKNTTNILFDEQDYPGVKRAILDLQSDIEKVSSKKPSVNNKSTDKQVIIIGTIGKNAIIDELIKNKKINVAGIAGKWESTLTEVVKNPTNDIEEALVIAGSDKRGTIYGIYEISYQIGVSPWHYWADVPAKKNPEIYVRNGRYITQSPAVKYRGIFLNDEAPALSGWAIKEFGGFNHKFYENVFELILRLKGNYLWPAMWGRAFNDDDPANPVIADEYGVVIGTSHHEPLTRAHDEWRRYGSGAWDYNKNPDKLKEFWETGLKRVTGKEQIITIGMRGDGDEPMTEGTATALLEKIVADQRAIIEKVSGKPASETPQLWALYKEVQDYYDKGMRVPDDVTLLLCDDNWGNIRKLPNLKEKPRKGGYGVYYHFDYVGGPRNYKWINTSPIQKTWEQMNLAYQYDANQIWIVNVGDLKPMEFPIEFFLDYAWSPDAIPAEQLFHYTVQWSAKQFGEIYAHEIADLINQYSKFNGRIKPELLDAKTYSLVNYNEFETVVKDYENLLERAKFISDKLPPKYRDAFYQLVLHPVEASANLYSLYYAHAKNQLYAKQQRNLTNFYAEETQRLFNKDAEITNYYNNIMAGGKWKHMMDQTHIGYTGWQQPETNVIPATNKINIPEKGKLGLAIEGDTSSWKNKDVVNTPFPVFDFYGNSSHYIELFNTGKQPVSYKIKMPKYIKANFTAGNLINEQKIYLQTDRNKAPSGKSKTNIVITGSEGSKITLPIIVDNRKFDIPGNIFTEQNGYIAMEAPNYSRAHNNRPAFWKTIPHYGKTLGGVTIYPATLETQIPDKHTPHLEYDIFLKDTGTFHLHTYISPTIDFKNNGGLKYAVSIDDDEPVIVNINKDYLDDISWAKSVANQIKIFKTPFTFKQNGKHTIKYWLIDTGVVLQKLVLDTGGLKESFLGPNETFVQE